MYINKAISKVWKARDTYIFHDIKLSTIHICSKIIAFFFEYCKDWKEKDPKLIDTATFVEDLSIGYFDGVGKNGLCGTGMVL